MIWTVVTFLLLVLVLTKAAWRPILKGLETREGKIKGDLDRAEKSQTEAEALRLKYETQLADAQKTIQDMVNLARVQGEKTRSGILASAKEESEKILERGRSELAGETERLKGELRGEVANLSVEIAEKILQKSVDKKVQEQVLADSLKSLKGVNK